MSETLIDKLPKIPQFDVKEIIGRGYWKEVWEAIRKSDGTRWALKFLKRTDVAYRQSEDRELSKDEIWYKENLGGSNTAFTNLAFSHVEQAEDGTRFLAEEYIDRFLSNYLEKNPELQFRETLSICKGIAQGLSDLHTRFKWIHADLKPDNIGYTLDGIVKITDFGTATQGLHDRANVGYEHTRAPENFSGEPTKSSDVYAFGSILYKMLTGKYIFEEEFEQFEKPEEFISYLYANKKRWKKAVNEKIKKIKTPRVMKSLLRKTLCHEEDRIYDGADLLGEVENTEKRYRHSSLESRLWRWGAPALAASMLIGLSIEGYQMKSRNRSLNGEVQEQSEELEWQSKIAAYKLFRRGYSGDDSMEFLKIADIKSWNEMFEDEKTAFYAYLDPETTYEAIQAAGGKTDYDSVSEQLEEIKPSLYLKIFGITTGVDMWARIDYTKEAEKRVNRRWEEAKQSYEEKQAAERRKQEMAEKKETVYSSIIGVGYKELQEMSKKDREPAVPIIVEVINQKTSPGQD